MDDDKLKRLRELSAGIKVSIGEASDLIAEIKGGPHREQMAGTLADLRRAAQLLELKLRDPK